MTYAGFWIRVGASIIDTILILILFVPLAMMIFNVNIMSDEVTNQHLSYWSNSFYVQGGDSVFLNYIYPAVFVLVFWFFKSATPGKMATRLTIVDAKTGKKPTFIQLLLRYVGYFLSSIFLLGFIWVAFDKRKQGWHDKLAGTVVVKDSSMEEAKFDE